VATTGRWKTALTYGERDSVVMRGYRLDQLVGRVSFPEAFLLLALGELPPAGHVRTLEAMFVSVLDHGIVPSSIVTRYLASSGTPLQAAVAGGVLAFGDTYGGACEQLAERLAHYRAPVAGGAQTVESAATALVRDFTARGLRVPGYGHALHPNGDPRVPHLYAIAYRNGVTGEHSRLARAVEAELAGVKGRTLPMNQDGALAALGLDLGLHWQLVRALAFVPRSAGLAVHAVEEIQRESGWRHVPDSEVDYDGPPLRQMPEA